MDPLFALSPLDGRYADRTKPLRNTLSEFALIKARVFVEVRWLLFLVSEGLVQTKPLSPEDNSAIARIADDFDIVAARRVKELEKVTNHDVKAVEYYIREKLLQIMATEAAVYIPLVHFACTSEDVNNVAYALNLEKMRSEVFLPKIAELLSSLGRLVEESADTPLLALTHGQPASPTTLGKEFSVFYSRIYKIVESIKNVKLAVKWNGATGTLAAHSSAVNGAGWLEISEKFLGQLTNSQSYEVNHFTTQIESHDNLSELLDGFARLCSSLIDACQDFWLYVSRGVLKLRKVESETGSSVMPHKVNPIDFENAEGNLHVANALFTSLARKLPVSRLQRDLTDSTCLRALAEAFGHCHVALDSVVRGLTKVAADEEFARLEIRPHFELLAEALQTCMRAEGVTDAYEQLKTLTRGRGVLSQQEYLEILDSLPLSEAKKAQLKVLTPETYVGEAGRLARLALQMYGVNKQ